MKAYENVTSLLGKAEGVASKGCDYLAANPMAVSALGPLAPHVTSACGLLKSYQTYKKPRPLKKRKTA